MLSPHSAVKQAARVLAAEWSSLDKDFRARLSSLGIDGAEKKRLARFNPGLLLRRVTGGQQSEACLQELLADARALVLSGIDLEAVRGALKMRVGHGHWTEREFAESVLRTAVISTVDRALHEAEVARCRLLDHIASLDSDSSDVASFLVAAAGAIRTYLQAAGVRVYELSSSKTHEEGARALPLILVNEARKSKFLKPLQLPRKRVSSAPDPSWAAEFESTWSLPLAVDRSSVWVATLGYQEQTPLLPGQMPALYLASARCQTAVGRILRHARLRVLSLRMLEIEEFERRRISRELHDDAAQSLAVIRLQLELAEGGLEGASEESRQQVADARGLVEKTILDVRRLISDLSPVVLEQLGLGAALRQLTTRFRRTVNADVVLHVGKLPEVNHRLAMVVYRALQECFTNIAKHSGATNINVSVTAADRVLRVHVQDDGVGFDAKQALSRPDRFGLAAIRERATLLGGYVAVRSTPRGGNSNSGKSDCGTEITIEFPL